MQIEKIILKNFRTHEYLEFEPAEVGITAISGANGSGKSTIVDGFAWSLFGTRQHNLKTANYIREGVDPSEEETGVTSFVKINNEHYKIERKIANASGTTQCRVSIKKPTGYEEIAGPTVTHAEEFVRKTLGLDEKGFLTSVFVQQKQVDQIISATPAQRGAVIEKMLGIDALTKAIQVAKEDSRGLQKAANVVRTSDLTSEKEELDNQIEATKKTEKELSDKLKDLDKLSVEKEELENKVKAEDVKIEKLKELKNQLTQNKALLAEKEKTNKENLALYKSIKNTVSSTIPESEIVSKQKELTKEINRLNSTIGEIKYQVTVDNETMTKVVKEKLLIEKQINENILEESKEELEEVKARALTLTNKLAEKNEYKKLILSGNATCPTCGQEIETGDGHLEETTKEVEDIISELSDVKVEMEELKVKIIEFRDIVEETKEQEIIKQEKIVAKERLETNNKLLNTYKSDLVKLESQNSVLSNQLAEIKEAENKRQLKESLKEKLLLADNEVEKLNNFIAQIKEQGTTIKETLDPNYKEFSSKLKSTTSDFNSRNLEVEILKERVAQGHKMINVLQSQYDKNLEAENKYKELTKSLNVLNHTVENLTRFKEDRLYRSIPKLTDMASDIISRLTSGEFTEIILDDKFKCSVVTRDNIVRPVEQLSGGELSMAAIALRLAISFFLSNNDNNLLILDEVLVSMNEERAQLALEVVSSIKNTQIILIAHNWYATDVADKVLNL